ncbi:MAG: hypothetical protein ACWGNV_11630, partial [Bacteroidales bacterium]
LDTLQGEPRLLISCSARRESQEPYGEIMAYFLESGMEKVLPRVGEPPGIHFRPHGIYLDGQKLFVISHEQEPDDHPVLIYMVEGDTLRFVDAVHTPLQISPNALVTGPEGEIYLVNDAGKRGSILEKALKLKRAGVVKINRNGEGNWKALTVADELGYPAGINRIGDTLYVGDAILHRIHVYAISEEGLEPVKSIPGVRGNDNIRIYNNRLLVPGHVKPFRFIKHARDPEKKSPVTVFLVNPLSGEVREIYATDGSAISAGSTALLYRGDLYISQVFEPYLLKIALR